MIDYRRTTVNVPAQLLKDAQLYGIEYNITFTDLVIESLSEKIKQPPQPKSKKSLLDLAGTLNLGGKEPPTRQEMYDQYIDEKMGY